MGTPIITAENLGKKYLLSHQRREPYTALRDVIAEKAKDLGRFFSRPFSSAPSPVIDPNQEEFWALKDVSFDVNEGDRIGIIGRNGAGKSTILKILSRITEPTEGRVRIKGRIASLLEVGTGFHPELTGRENIFLNGAILGMTKSEITRKFEEIVSFAEVERFLDTPVKRYSSGMYVRLAFSVAAHLEPEILIVDEVLAVGDLQFQKKCLGKMQNAGREGRTVLFVSHNMESLSSLCNMGILLTSGRIHYQGNIREAIATYTGSLATSPPSMEHCSRRGGEGGIRIENLWVTDSQGGKIHQSISGEPITVCIEASVSSQYRNRPDVNVGIGIDTMDGHMLVTCVSSWIDKQIETRSDRLRIRCILPFLPLIPDTYLISVSISIRGITLDYIEHCYHIRLLEKGQAALFKGRQLEHGRMEIPYRFEAEDV
jgi:lipopolysaccharide transport system ATP-binding protein